MGEQIERLVTVWDANFTKLDDKLDKIARKHSQVANRITRDASSFTNQLEAKYGRAGKAFGNVFNDSRLATMSAGASHLRIFGSALEPLGVAGLAAAAGLAALGVAAQQTVAAMKFADEIDDAAQKLNIGTDALQEYRFAMTEVGGTAQDADTALASFSATLGAAQSGLSPKAMKGFAALGFSQETVRSWATAEDALPSIAAKVAALGGEAERAAVAEKLGLGAMLPLLRDGADGMEELRQKARDLGIVMDSELVSKGAEANQQFETLSQVISVQMKSAFIGLSDEVVAFTGAIANALKGLNDFIGGYNNWSQRQDAIHGPGYTEKLLFTDFGGAMAMEGRSLVSGRQGRVRAALANPRTDADDPAMLRQQMAVENANRPRSASGSRLISPSARSGGRGRSNTAEQRARREDQFEKQIERLQAEILRAWDNEFESISSDTGNKLVQLQADHEAKLREITDAEAEYAKSNGLRGLAATEAAQLRGAQEQLFAIEESNLKWRERRAQEDYRFEIEQDASRAAIDLLDLQAQTAVTARERFEVERRILALTLKAERDAQKRDLANDPNIDDGERARRLREGDRGRQARFGNQGASSEGAQRGRAAIAGVRNPADEAQAHQDALDAIAKWESEDVDRHRTAMQARAQIDAEYANQRLSGTRSMLDMLSGLQGSSNKKLAAIGKAAALAQAGMDGYVAIQKAWASAPFPFNLPAVAVTTAVTTANVAAIAGFERGGYTGNGGTSDVAGMVHGQEYVFDAAATRRIGVPALEAMRNGSGSPLISGLLSSAQSKSMTAPPSSAYHFSPQIDARGADNAAVSRLEQMLTEQRRSFASDVNAVREKRAKWKSGRRQ